MKPISILISLISLSIIGCRNTAEPIRQLFIPAEFTIYSDEDSVVCNNIQSFVKQHDKTMFALYNSDCSACLVGMSLWFRFAQEHPEVTPLFATYTEQSKKAFWLQTYTYYSEPIYAFFDKKFEFFRTNQIPANYDTFIVDSTGRVIAEGVIGDKKFEKQYLKYLKYNFQKHPVYHEGTFSSVLEIARQQNKPIWMILGGGKNCMACEQLLKNMTQEGIFNDFKDDYIFYRCNVEHPANTFLKYIFLMESIPNSYIVSPDGKMVSFYAGQLRAEEISQQLTAVKEGYPMYPSRHSQFKSVPKRLLYLQNLLLTAYPGYIKAGGDTSQLKKILPTVQKSIAMEPYFYNLYLAAKVCQQLNDTTQASHYAEQALQICPDGFQTIIYRPLISELQQLYSAGDTPQSFAQITFEHQQLQLRDNTKDHYIFRFKNTGNQPLLIKHVSSSCSCAKPEWSQQPVLPGEKGEIKIHYHPDKNKAFSKTFWVQSNANNKIELLTLKGTH